MFRNFLIIGLRFIRRYKLFSTISILGLSISLACVLVLFTYVMNERSVDQFHTQKDKVYLTTIRQTSVDGTREIGLTTINTEKWLMKNGVVEKVHHLRYIGDYLLSNDNVEVERTITMAGPEFFEFFDFDLLSGNTTALDLPNSIVLSESAAQALFGSQNPVGQFVNISADFNMTLQVTGVINEIKNSHLKYDCIISWDSKTEGGQTMGDWYQYSQYSYIKTMDNWVPEQLNIEMEQQYRDEFPEDNMVLRFCPLDEIYLMTGKVEFMSGFRAGNDQRIFILSLISALILIIGLVNFLNINISILLKRSREIGVRKAVGASITNLSVQLMMENFIVLLISGLVSITLADLAVKYGAYVLSDTFVINPLNYLPGIAFLISAVVILSLLSGLYPIIFIRQFKLSRNLQSQAVGSGNHTLRHVFLGIQFMITFGLLVMSFVIYDQYRFIDTKELGFVKDEVLILPISNSNKLQQSRTSFLNELNQIPEVISASIATDALGDGYTNNSFYAITPSMTDVKAQGVMTTYFGVDTAFLNTYGIRLIEGRDFFDRESDRSAVIINRKLARELGLDDPIGQRLKLFGKDSPEMTVIGVVHDFHFQSLYKEVDPVAIYLNNRNYWNAAIRFSPENISPLLQKLRQSWEAFDQEVPFKYNFLDQRLDEYYAEDKKFNKIVGFFTLLSVILSMIGLYGLTSFNLENRLKEISLRKVLGASIGDLLIQFNKRYILLLLVALLVAVPASVIWVQRWLQNFAYHTQHGGEMYLVSAMAILLLILITVSLTSLKAANSNPARYLRDE